MPKKSIVGDLPRHKDLDHQPNVFDRNLSGSSLQLFVPVTASFSSQGQPDLLTPIIALIADPIDR